MPSLQAVYDILSFYAAAVTYHTTIHVKVREYEQAKQKLEKNHIQTYLHDLRLADISQRLMVSNSLGAQKCSSYRRTNTVSLWKYL